MKKQHPQATAFPMTSLEILREDLKKRVRMRRSVKRAQGIVCQCDNVMQLWAMLHITRWYQVMLHKNTGTNQRVHKNRSKSVGITANNRWKYSEMLRAPAGKCSVSDVTSVWMHKGNMVRKAQKPRSLIVSRSSTTQSISMSLCDPRCENSQKTIEPLALLLYKVTHQLVTQSKVNFWTLFTTVCVNVY